MCSWWWLWWCGEWDDWIKAPIELLLFVDNTSTFPWVHRRYIVDGREEAVIFRSSSGRRARTTRDWRRIFNSNQLWQTDNQKPHSPPTHTAGDRCIIVNWVYVCDYDYTSISSLTWTEHTRKRQQVGPFCCCVSVWWDAKQKRWAVLITLAAAPYTSFLVHFLFLASTTLTFTLGCLI